jgi:hypothetical protein
MQFRAQRRLRGILHSTDPHHRTRVRAHEPVRPIYSSPGNGRHTHGSIAWAVASAACILTAALALAFLVREAGQGKAKLSAEIYFDNPSNIATWTSDRSVAFSFVVHNLAGKPYDARYVISVTDKRKTNKVVVDKVVALGSNQRIMVRTSLKPPNSAKSRISVSLAGTANVIFFWTRAPSLRSVH